MKKQTLETNAAALKRWRSRLKRAMSMLDKLERQRKRLEAKPQAGVPSLGAARATARKADPHQPAAHPVELLPVPVLLNELEKLAAEADTGIPAFLQRKKLDPVAEQIKADQEATKKAKARGRIEKMKAKQRGDLKKMPLTGKAALDAIRGA